MKGNRTKQGQPEVVPTYQLSNVIRAWIHQREREYVETKAFSNKEFITPLKYIQFHSGVNERTLNGIARAEFKTTTIELAEKILIAIGKEHLLGTEVQIIPSPYWSLEKYIEYVEEHGSCI